MKKLTTLFGLLFCASIILTSCGGPEADAEKFVDCVCDAAESKDEDALAKCMEMAEEHETKYKDNEDDTSAYEKAMIKAMADCDAAMDELDLF